MISGVSVLYILREHGKIEIKTLVSKLKLDGRTSQGALFRILEQLEEQGLIVVENDAFQHAQWDLYTTISISENTSKLIQVLGISLKETSKYDHRNSVICNPRFENPKEISKGDESDIFVLMPFRTELTPVYDDHIKSVARKLGLSIKRGDDFFSAHRIMKDVWAGIYNAKVIIADCTDRNPNVFYEIGIAHTIGKPVILITQSIDDVPFDIRDFRFIKYNYTPPGMKEFEKSLEKTIKKIVSP